MFQDRIDAGVALAARLDAYRDAEATIVLGIPRGGVVVAAEIGRRLRLPLGIAAVRKVGAPGNAELAIGAVDDESGELLDRRLAAQLGLGPEQLAAVAAAARERLRDWLATIPESAGWPEPGHRVILVDDGVATGYTAQAAVEAAQRHGARLTVLAVPVAPVETARWLKRMVDEWVCLATPEPFYAVGNFFDRWPQVTDDQVRALLLAGNRM